MLALFTFFPPVFLRAVRRPSHGRRTGGVLYQGATDPSLLRACRPELVVIIVIIVIVVIVAVAVVNAHIHHVQCVVDFKHALDRE